MSRLRKQCTTWIVSVLLFAISSWRTQCVAWTCLLWTRTLTVCFRSWVCWSCRLLFQNLDICLAHIIKHLDLNHLLAHHRVRSGLLALFFLCRRILCCCSCYAGTDVVLWDVGISFFWVLLSCCCLILLFLLWILVLLVIHFAFLFFLVVFRVLSLLLLFGSPLGLFCIVTIWSNLCSDGLLNCITIRFGCRKWDGSDRCWFFKGRSLFTGRGVVSLWLWLFVWRGERVRSASQQKILYRFERVLNWN